MGDGRDPLAGLRRVITANDAGGRSRVMIDGPPGAEFRTGGLGGLFEIWTDGVSGALDGREGPDRAEGKPMLCPPQGHVKIRWFVIAPTPPDAPPEMIREATRAAFIEMGAGGHQPDTRKHPGMHLTHTIDAIILVSGRARLVLDDVEVEIGPGDVVVQRATNHAWSAVGDAPAVFVAVLIDRS